MLEFIFFSCLVLIIYAYAGYPVLLTLVIYLRKKEFKKAEIYPSVSLIIAAYNEEKSIERKIKNSLEMDYPKDKLEIIVASDHSTDKTNEIVKNFSLNNVKLSVAESRAGKTAGRNRVIPEARGEIIVLTDATGIYEKDAIKKLVRNFFDERIGCVGGTLKYINPSNSTMGSGEGLYWRYEVMLRRKESLLGSLTAVSGSIYAFRKVLYRGIPKELADDLIMPLLIKKMGYSSIFEPEAVCTEEAARDEKEESAKRIRIANRNIMGLLYMKELLNVFKYGVFSVQLVSHKILRLVMPVMLILFFLASYALAAKSFFYYSFVLIQLVFYLSACIGLIMQRGHKNRSRIFYIPMFFCVTNLGVLKGILKFILGERKAIWEPSR